jgi:hypothetical protein
VKILSLIGLLLLVSCGAPNQNNEASGGSSRYSPIPLTTDQMAVLSNICSAVDDKTARLDGVNGTEHVFSYKADNCDSNPSIKVHDVTVKVDLSRDSSGNDIYSFLPVGNESFPFKEIETTSTGVVSKMCANIRDTSSNGGKDAILLDATGLKALWFMASSSSECQPDDTHQCLFLVYGYKNANGDYDHATREVLKFDMHDKRGYFVSRVKRSSIGCKTGESIMAAVLK